MILRPDELKKISDLAYIAVDETSAHQLTNDIKAILDFVEELKRVDTTRVTPLFHPLDLKQPLRPDIISETDEQGALAKIAPKFEGDLYLVPKVIETSK